LAKTEKALWKIAFCDEVFVVLK